MQKLTNQEKLRPWMGAALQGAVVLFLLFVGSWMQAEWGIWGLVATELSLLVIALGCCLVRGVSLKEVFPIRKITLKDFFGTVLFTVGGVLAASIAAGISLVIFPSRITELSSLNDFIFGKVPFVVMLLIVAVLPAVCEEAIQRGAVLSHFRSINKDWVIVLIMGVFFGVIHLSPLRFLSMTCAGMLLSYLMVKRNNMLLPMLMHFLNNIFAAVSGSLSAGQDAGALLAATDTLTLLGLYLIVGYTFPVIITLGAMLISPETHKKKRFLYAGIASGVMLVIGLLLVIVPWIGKIENSAVNTVINYELTAEHREEKIAFDIKEDGRYSFSADINALGGNFTFELTDGDGNAVIEENHTAPFQIKRELELGSGCYTVRLVGAEDAIGTRAIMQIRAIRVPYPER